MNSIKLPFLHRFRQLSKHSRYFIMTAVFGLMTTFVMSIPSEYTKKSYVAATVVAKTKAESTHKGTWTPHFILALRHPDGTLQDVRTSYAIYATTDIGSTWGVMYSDFDRDRPMPTQYRVKLGLTILLLLGTVFWLAGALSYWLFPED